MKFKIFAILIGLFSLAGCASGSKIVEENRSEGTFTAKYQKWGDSGDKKNHEAALDLAREKCRGDFEIVKDRTVVEPHQMILFPNGEDTFVELTFRCKKS